MHALCTVVSCKYAPPHALAPPPPPAFLVQSPAEVFYPVHKPPPQKKTYPAVELLRLFLFKPFGCLPLKCLLRTRIAHINDGHASYSMEAPCFLTPQR